MLLTGGADGEILIWKASFGPVQQLDKENEKVTSRKKIRASLVTGLNGVDVKKVIGSTGAETNDIEEARPKVSNQALREERAVEKAEIKSVSCENDKLLGAAPTTLDSRPPVCSQMFAVKKKF